MGVAAWSHAEQDMEQLLKLEPKNKKAQEILKQAREEIARSEDTVPKKKGRKVHIEEVDEEDTPSPAPDPTPGLTNGQPASTAPIPTPMPAEVVTLKERGNDLFRRGQYGAAVDQYTTAVQKLEEGGCSWCAPMWVWCGVLCSNVGLVCSNVGAHGVLMGSRCALM